MNGARIVAIAVFTGSAIAADAGADISRAQATEKVRALVAPVCGKGRAFSCTIAYDSRKGACRFEFIVALPKEPAAARAKAFWVCLDERGRIVSLETNRELLCPSA